MSKNKILSNLLKTIDNPYASIASDGIIGGDIKGFIDSGSYILNGLISGNIYDGFAKGKVTALAGKKGSGKTFILMKTVQEFLDDNPDNIFILFESEGAVTQNMLIERGIDMDRVMVSPIMTVEDLRNQSILILDEFLSLSPDDRPNILIGLDSLGMLSTEFEINTATENANKADMGKRAQLIKSVFRLITLKLGILDVPMIITNHIYSTMGLYSPDKMGGGTGLEFAASNIVFLTKVGDKERIKNINVLIGNIIKCIMHKGRLTVEGSSCNININFKTGLNRFYGLLEFAVDNKIITKKGRKYYIDDELFADNKKMFYDNADVIFTEDILSKINVAIGNAYKYGSAIDDISEIETKKL